MLGGCRRLLGDRGDLARGGADGSDAVGDVDDGVADRLECLARLVDGGDAALRPGGALRDGRSGAGGLGLDLADQRGDRLGGRLGALGELPDLLGDDREAAALLACPCGLDGGVQRQEVGLGGDGRDGPDDASICSLRLVRPSMTCARSAEASARVRIAAVVWPALDASWATLLVWAAACVVSLADVRVRRARHRVQPHDRERQWRGCRRLCSRRQAAETVANPA